MNLNDIDPDYEGVYDCTATDHTDCDSNYCDTAYEMLIEDEEGSEDTSLERETFREYNTIHPEERDDDDWVGG